MDYIDNAYDSSNALMLLLLSHLTLFSVENARKYGPVLIDVPPTGIQAIRVSSVKSSCIDLLVE